MSIDWVSVHFFEVEIICFINVHFYMSKGRHGRLGNYIYFSLMRENQ